MVQSACPSAVLEPDYERLWRTGVSQEPFPHFAVPRFLSPEAVAAIVHDFPRLDMGALSVREHARGALRETIDILEFARHFLSGKIKRARRLFAEIPS